jgi:Glycosyl hydrolase family 12
MVRRARLFVPALALALVLGLGATSASAVVWSSTDRFGSWSSGGYTLFNDVWGSGAGPQTIWANSPTNWGVWANHPNTGGVKSYPNISKTAGPALSALHSVSSSFNVTVPGTGAYETAYDIWCANNAFEIMLWMNRTGAVGPLGSRQTSATVGGHTWDVFRGSNGSNQVFSFVRQGNVTASSVDILAVLRWLQARGWFGNVTLGQVQFGFEITSSSGGLNFVTNSYSASFS